MKSIFFTAALLAALATAQAPARPRIEVATIKLNTGGGGRGGMRGTPGRFTVSNTPLRTLIRNAYKVPDFTISGGPVWMNTDRYDIEAKVEGELRGDDLLFVLRTLLEDRFQLKVHRETKEGPVYLLTVAKGGPRLPPSSCVAVDPSRMPPPPAPGEKLPEICGLNRGGGSGPSRLLNIVGLRIEEPDSAATVPGLTFYFSSILERTVIDKTGLTGRFDVHLEYRPELDGEGPSIFTAVQEQLGLKLESGKGPVETLVIDHVERPSQN
jgi:uncharacterized protein (TIGR03435 family)